MGIRTMETLALMLLVISIPVTIVAFVWAYHLHNKNREILKRESLKTLHPENASPWKRAPP
jgi:dolichyl-phosphate-mannose--protein O-mannosyl transferase